MHKTVSFCICVSKKTPIKLRIKKLADGNGSYYLDWFQNGKRHYEYLKLYTLLSDRPTKEEREANKESLKLAQQIRNQRESQLIASPNGITPAHKRKLGQLLANVDKGDRVIGSELSRLGRKLLMEILNILMKKEVELWTIKDNLRPGNSIESKVLAFAFGLSAEIERNLIFQRTKEALARKKAEGVVLGRPVGSKSSYTKLTGKEERITSLLDKNISKSATGRILGVNRLTVTKFINDGKMETSVH